VGTGAALKYAGWRHPASAPGSRSATSSPSSRRATRRSPLVRDQGRKGHVGGGPRADADVTVRSRRLVSVGANLLMPPINWLDQINARRISAHRRWPRIWSIWFAQTVMMSQSVGLKMGIRLATAPCAMHMTNGGPVFVYVKTANHPHDPDRFRRRRSAAWTIEARGLKLNPPRRPRCAPWATPVDRSSDRAADRGGDDRLALSPWAPACLARRVS